MKIKTYYDATEKVGLNFDKSDPKSRSVTNQSDKDLTDVNKIMGRYEKTGLLPQTTRQPIFGDFTEIGDYHQVCQRVVKVNEAFLCLPAGVRSKFLNDPQNLIAFLNDTNNDREAVQLGLKDESVLRTALADDGVTRILPEQREALNKTAAAKAATVQPANPAA